MRRLRSETPLSLILLCKFMANELEGSQVFPDGVRDSHGLSTPAVPTLCNSQHSQTPSLQQHSQKFRTPL